MKIATFNVNGVNGRLAVLLRWLEETAPDVVCVQELKSETFPQAAVREAGYEAIWRGEKSWNGVAILAKNSEPQEIRRGGAGKGKPHAFGGEQRIHPGAQGGNGRLALRREMRLEVQDQVLIGGPCKKPFPECFVAKHPVEVGEGEAEFGKEC